MYFLQDKSEAFMGFKSYKYLVENEVGIPIKIHRTDRGGKYYTNDFANFYEAHGIKRQLTIAYSTSTKQCVREEESHNSKYGAEHFGKEWSSKKFLA